MYLEGKYNGVVLTKVYGDEIIFNPTTSGALKLVDLQKELVVNNIEHINF